MTDLLRRIDSRLNMWLERHDEETYAAVLFFGGATIGGAVTVLLIHFLTGWS